MKKVKFYIWLKFFLGVSILVLIFSAISGYVFVSNLSEIGNYAVESVEKVKTLSVDDSKSALEDLGAATIKNQALAAKELVALYIKQHPNKTGDDFINDPEFQRIAIQPVGETGYTTVIRTKTQNMIAHPNKALMGKSFLSVIEKPEWQSWWGVVKNTFDNNTDSEGYYEWQEADGSFSKKYMYLAVVEGVKVDGQDISVAATTYIDEFNQPAVDMEKKLNSNVTKLVSDINNSGSRLQRSVVTIIVFMLIFAIVFSFIFSKSITNPIKKLMEAASQVAAGNLDAKADVTSNDEIGELATDFNAMTEDLKKSRGTLEQHSKDLEEEVKKRTKELQEKNESLEKFNKVAVNREVKMTEMKETIAQLEAKLKGKK